MALFWHPFICSFGNVAGRKNTQDVVLSATLSLFLLLGYFRLVPAPLLLHFLAMPVSNVS